MRISLMSRESTVNYEALAQYCFEPRSIADICAKFSLSLSQAHRVMTKLTWSGKISTRMESGNGAQRKVFLLTGLESERNWVKTNSLRDSLPAHDPFGIARRRAL